MAKPKHNEKSNPFKEAIHKVEEITKKEEPKKEEASKVNKEDRSAFNCSPCKGEGLVDGKICISCNGTGKV